MKKNPKWLSINNWFICIFSFFLWVALGPVYGAGDSDFERETVSEFNNGKISCFTLTVNFDPELEKEDVEYFCYSCSDKPYFISYFADLQYKTLYESGEELWEEFTRSEGMVLAHVQISIAGIFNIFLNQTVLAIPGMAISDEGVDLQEDYKSYGDYISVLDTVPIEIQKNLVDGLIEARKDLAYCRTYFENGDDARFKFLEALFARVESLP